MLRHDHMDHADHADHADSSPLVVVTTDPFNAETRLDAQMGVLTPNPAFYVRDHFSMPRIDPSDWRLTLDGEVTRPLALTYYELRALPSHTLLVTLECAGNGRRAFEPPAEGEPFGYGVASTAEWTGVPLRTVLEAAGPRPTAREVLFVGADSGPNPEAGGVTMAFERSLPIERAMHPDTLLAYAMNGEELPTAHGFPLRVLVPGWYGVAAVKWLVRISALASPFAGFFQRERYVMVHPERGDTTATPLTTIPPRSQLVAPTDGARLPRGVHLLHGLAWSGTALVERVEVSADDGRTWRVADWTSEPARYAWRTWEYRWDATSPGPATLRSRALDAAGHTQPAAAEWNRLGYANNAIQVVHVTIA
jgi:DMSO/TMAO reductase YedYZ molybdopterin-dependent catalytic subunit